MHVCHEITSAHTVQNRETPTILGLLGRLAHSWVIATELLLKSDALHTGSHIRSSEFAILLRPNRRAGSFASRPRLAAGGSPTQSVMSHLNRIGTVGVGEMRGCGGSGPKRRLRKGDSTYTPMQLQGGDARHGHAVVTPHPDGSLWPPRPSLKVSRKRSLVVHFPFLSIFQKMGLFRIRKFGDLSYFLAAQ